MSDLTGFLLARLAEDEATARAIHADSCGTPADTVLDSMKRPMSPTCDCDWSVARVLAEVEAKRRIVTTVDLRHVGGDDGYGIAFEDVCKELASVYSDHPDCRQEWRV